MGNTPRQEPTVGLYLGSYSGPGGMGLFLMSEVPLYGIGSQVKVLKIFASLRLHRESGYLFLGDDVEELGVANLDRLHNRPAIRPLQGCVISSAITGAISVGPTILQSDLSVSYR